MRAAAGCWPDELLEAKNALDLAFSTGDRDTTESSSSEIWPRTKSTMASSANGNPLPKHMLDQDGAKTANYKYVKTWERLPRNA